MCKNEFKEKIKTDAMGNCQTFPNQNWLTALN